MIKELGIRDESEDPTFWDLARAALDYEPDSGNLIWVVDWGSGESHKIAGRIRKFGRGKVCKKYRVVGLDFRRFTAHRLIWFWVTGKWPTLVDHWDGDSLNNRWGNLRDASYQTNAENKRRASKNNKLGVLGVSKHGKMFRASITVHGVNLALGSFPDLKQASEAYVKAKRSYHAGCTI